MPLRLVLEQLPTDLRAKLTIPVADLGQASVFIPTEQVRSQLASGAVKIQFGQLRAARAGLFSGGEEDDTFSVPLPLQEVLAQLDPKMFARAPGRKVAHVSDDITGPFAPPGGAARPAAAPAIHGTRPPAAVLPAAPAPPERDRGELNHALRIPRDATPPAAAKSAPARAKTTPARAKTTPAPDSILAPLSTVAGRWPEPLRVGLARVNLADAEVALPFNALEAALKRGRVAFPWRTLRTWLRPRPPTALSFQEDIELDLPLRTLVPLFLAQCEPPDRTRVLLPSAEIPNLISGFPQPSAAGPLPAPPAAGTAPQPAAPPPSPAPAAPSAPEPAPAPDTPVVQPVAPPVSAGPEAAGVETPVAPEPAAKPESPPTPPAPKTDRTLVSGAETPAAPPPAVPVKMEHPPAPASDTDLITRRATPKEIVGRAMELPGVAGAIVALPGGLPVARRVPEGMDADRLAAFFPQLFTRAGQSASELQMGELSSLSFTVGEVPWTIFRADIFRNNPIYFAAFGRAGQPLPGTRLAALAAELDRKRQH